MLAKDSAYLNIGVFQCICLYRELIYCLLNTSCIIEVNTKTNFTVLKKIQSKQRVPDQTALYVQSDQTALYEQSDLGLFCLHMLFLSV